MPLVPDTKVCESLVGLMGGVLKVVDVAGRKFFYCARVVCRQKRKESGRVGEISCVHVVAVRCTGGEHIVMRALARIGRDRL